MVDTKTLSDHKIETIKIKLENELLPKLRTSVRDNVLSIVQNCELLDEAYNTNDFKSRKHFESIIEDALTSSRDKTYQGVLFRGISDEIYTDIIEERCIVVTSSVEIDTVKEQNFLNFNTVINESDFVLPDDQETSQRRFDNFWNALIAIDDVSP
jgi:hypothetical protein